MGREEISDGGRFHVEPEAGNPKARSGKLQIPKSKIQIKPKFQEPNGK
jgi:hypothetical protein